MEFVDWVANKILLLNFLAFFLLILNIISVIIFFRCGKEEKIFAEKLIGIIFIALLSILADYWTVYALCIIIIATIITELDFLEKLAALFMHQTAYWEWRTKKEIREATLTEQIQKVQAEEVAVQEPEQLSEENAMLQTQEKSEDDKILHTCNVKPSLEENKMSYYVSEKDRGFLSQGENVWKAMAYEREIIELLRLNMENYIQIKPSMKIGNNKVNFIIDGLIEGPYFDYLVEVKYNILSKSALHKAVSNLRKQILMYRNITKKEARGLLIIPDSEQDYQEYMDDIFILKVDQCKKKFINIDMAKGWIINPFCM